MKHSSVLATAVLLSLASSEALTAPRPVKHPATSVNRAATSADAALTRVRSAEGITEYALPNGLHVLTMPDNSKPTTTVNLTVKVGSRLENYGETGMAHLLEHLMFRGTPTHKEVWKEFRKRGLRANGTTSQDRTNYFASMAENPANLSWYLNWLADALVNSNVSRVDLDSEMTVVRNEMEGGENNPGNILYERVVSAAYEWHSYGKQTIGARSDVENVNIPHLQAFYHRYYQPDNAVLIITGKFDEQATLKMVASTFGAIARPSRTLEPTYTLDPPQDGEREVTLRRAGDSPSVMTAYHIPAGSSKDYAAADIAGIILGGQDFRLNKALVETQNAADVGGSAISRQEPGLIIFEADLKSGQSPDKTLQLLEAQVEGVNANPFTQAELDRAKSVYLRGFDQVFNDPEHVGVALSEYVSLGDWRLMLLRRDEIRALNVDDVNRFATTYLIQSNRTAGRFLPTPSPVRTPFIGRVDVQAELKDFQPKAAVSQGEAFDSSTENIARRAQSGQLANDVRYTFLQKKTRGDRVTGVIALHFGTVESLNGKETIGNMTAGMLNRGTEHYTRAALTAAFESLQATYSITGGATGVNFSFETTRDRLPQVLALANEVLKHPKVSAEELEQLRTAMLAGTENGKDDPATLLTERIERHGNPYHRGDLRYFLTIDESLADIQAVSLKDVQAFYDRFYGGSKATVTFVGDFDDAKAKAALTDLLGQWSSKEAYVRVPMPWYQVTPEEFKLDVKDKQEAIMLAKMTFPLREDTRDFQALRLAAEMVGGGGGRLWNRIRERDGLSYSVDAGINGGQFNANATWEASASFAPQNGAKVLAAFKEELARARTEGFSAEEVERAKQSIAASLSLGRSRDRYLAPALDALLEREKPVSYLSEIQAMRNSISVDEVNAAYRKWIDPAQLTLGEAGDFTLVVPNAAPSGAGSSTTSR